MWIYGAEKWTLTKESVLKLRVVPWKIERSYASHHVEGQNMKWMHSKENKKTIGKSVLDGIWKVAGCITRACNRWWDKKNKYEKTKRCDYPVYRSDA